MMVANFYALASGSQKTARTDGASSGGAVWDARALLPTRQLLPPLGKVGGEEKNKMAAELTGGGDRPTDRSARIASEAGIAAGFGRAEVGSRRRKSKVTSGGWLDLGGGLRARHEARGHGR